MTLHTFGEIVFWVVQIALAYALVGSVYWYFFIKYDATETARRRYIIKTGSAFIGPFALGCMYAVWKIAEALGL